MQCGDIKENPARKPIGLHQEYDVIEEQMTGKGGYPMNYGPHITLGNLLDRCREIPADARVLVYTEDYPNGEGWYPATYTECRYNTGEERAVVDYRRGENPLNVGDFLDEASLATGNPFAPVLKLIHLDEESGYRMPVTELRFEQTENTLYVQ